MITIRAFGHDFVVEPRYAALVRAAIASSRSLAACRRTIDAALNAAYATTHPNQADA